jgi:hypothetical protein
VHFRSFGIALLHHEAIIFGFSFRSSFTGEVNAILINRLTKQLNEAPFSWQNFWGEIPVALSLLFGKIYPIID